MRERGDVGRVEPDRPGRRRAVFDMRADACAVTFGAHLIEPIFALALPQRDLDAPAPHAAGQIMEKADSAFRSEEHTSELQSLMRNSYAVFSFKKTNINIK